MAAFVFRSKIVSEFRIRLLKGVALAQSRRLQVWLVHVPGFQGEGLGFRVWGFFMTAKYTPNFVLMHVLYLAFSQNHIVILKAPFV